MSVIAFLWTRLPSIWATLFVSSGMWKILMLPLLLPAHYNITFRLTLLSLTYVVNYIYCTKVHTFYICMLYYFNMRVGHASTHERSCPRTRVHTHMHHCNCSQFLQHTVATSVSLLILICSYKMWSDECLENMHGIKTLIFCKISGKQYLKEKISI